MVEITSCYMKQHFTQVQRSLQTHSNTSVSLYLLKNRKLERNTSNFKSPDVKSQPRNLCIKLPYLLTKLLVLCQIQAEIPQFFSQIHISGQWTRISNIAVSKILATNSLNLWMESYIARCCRSLISINYMTSVQEYNLIKIDCLFSLHNVLDTSREDQKASKFSECFIHMSCFQNKPWLLLIKISEVKDGTNLRNVFNEVFANPVNDACKRND